MLIKQPIFNLDGDASAPSTEGSWGDLAASTISDETPANDEQPIADSDAEGLETELAEGQDAVEPTPDEAETPVSTFSDDTEVDLGEGRQPVKLTELKQGYLRQSDYTKKTQELATQRKDIETQLEQVKPMQEWLTYANNNPYLWQQINSAIQQWESTGHLPLDEVMEDAQYAKWINGYQSEVSKLAKENTELKSRLGDVEFTTGMDKAINDLKGEYGTLMTPEYEQTLRDRAKSQGLSTEVLKEIADGHLTKQKLQQSQQQAKKATKEAEAKTIQSLQEKRSALPPQPRATGQRPSNDVTDTSEMSWFEIAKMSGSKR